MRNVLLYALAAIASILIITPPQDSSALSSGPNSIISEKTERVQRYHLKDAKKDCQVCHSAGHQAEFRLKSKESDVCYQCHPKVDDAKWAHGPVGVGQCSVCHDPHGSAAANFLVRKREALCTFCHEESGLRKHVAAVGSNDCTSCHDPHSGENNSLLRR